MVKKKGALYFKDGHIEYILDAKILKEEDLNTPSQSTLFLVVTNADVYQVIETLKFEPPTPLGEDPFEFFSPKHFKWSYMYFKDDQINNKLIQIDEPERVEFYPLKKRRLKRKPQN